MKHSTLKTLIAVVSIPLSCAVNAQSNPALVPGLNEALIAKTAQLIQTAKACDISEGELQATYRFLRAAWSWAHVAEPEKATAFENALKKGAESIGPKEKIDCEGVRTGLAKIYDSTAARAERIERVTAEVLKTKK